jgi:glycosyltransferase involved in cell wall biosynthesis
MNDVKLEPLAQVPLAPWRAEAEIMRDWNGPVSSPTVSICCATHNHRNWIEDALRGFLCQETRFPFEIIVRDDASQDGTTEIVREFARRYPNIVRPLINAENRFSKGERPSHVWHTIARGKFVALCEGDDYWISPSKLQKQVDLLEAHPEAVMSVALTYQQKGGAPERQMFSTVRTDAKTLLDFEDVHSSYYHTSTYVIRSDILFPVIQRYFMGRTVFGDTALRAILVSLGPFALLPEPVSVYRETGKGIWTSLDKLTQLQWEFDSAKGLADLLSGKHAQRQRSRLYGISLGMFKVHTKRGSLLPGLRWAPRVLWYGVRKIPGYISKKLSLP